MRTIIVFLALFATCHCWENEQLEVFDVVEEVKENFYQMLNLSNNATGKEIKSAFRRLSLVLHPDKNPHEDAAMQFRNLVSVYEVLKDEKKRGYYDDVLINGLPNWKSAMFYYRRVRKIGILEGALIIFLIITVGQYIVAWAVYAEKIYTLDQVAKPKGKKNAKTQSVEAPVVIETVPKPSVFNTLPFQIPYWSFMFVISIPSFVLFTKELVNEKIEERREAAAQALKDEQEEEEAAAESRTTEKEEKVFEIPEGPTFEANYGNSNNSDSNSPAPPPVSGGFWSDDDLDELVQLVKKYPGGTPKRWEVIAQCMNRSVAEVTFMANRMKANGYTRQQEEEPVVEVKVKTKTKGVEETPWSNAQQQALEDALRKFGKEATDRWERIAELVPDKSKEECMIRYKRLVAEVKKKKEKKEE
ncbi:LOW QUALITY PROTEIN: dnaJ homolog subfamily C member 1 [Atheta coriaria]|uniref:LOW QUALITY PROTEIN: dnaJ homolog subfamily C member 1 n=1 Tax=Dalotia coriaria TaxID=877792 RepID=UPI0031F3ECC6